MKIVILILFSKLRISSKITRGHNYTLVKKQRDVINYTFPEDYQCIRRVTLSLTAQYKGRSLPCHDHLGCYNNMETKEVNIWCCDGSVSNFLEKKHYKGVKFNVIRATRGWMGDHL